MNQEKQHRTWSKSSPSTKEIRVKLLNDCLDNIRSKRNSTFNKNRTLNDSGRMELVDELISSCARNQHESMLDDISYDEYYRYIMEDVEFMGQLEDTLRYELEYGEVDEYVESADLPHGYTIEEAGDDLVLCPICRSNNLVANNDMAVSCQCGVYFRCSSGTSIRLEDKIDNATVYLDEIRDKIANMYDRHYSECGLRNDTSFASHRTLQFHCSNEQLSGWCSYCGFSDTL